MSLIILTKSPIFSFKDLIRQIKYFVKYVLGQKRGPDIVTSSLLNGLKELNYKYKYNINQKKIFIEDTIYVNDSVEALRWAIEAKKEGKIKKLIVGPIISVLPHDHNSIMLNKEIDLILFPSEWTKNHWLSTEKSLENKIQIWPVGVTLPVLSKDDRDTVLVYYKKVPGNLFEFIKNFLNRSNIKFHIINYGLYRQKRYFSLLRKAKVMIYLSESESQGLAMFEAWSYNVPTLVWNRGYWQYGNNRWEDDKISSPYLVEDCGLFFKNQNDFPEVFNCFINKLPSFSPRNYIANNYTNKKIAQNFLGIITG